jgi:hypothetical protein
MKITAHIISWIFLPLFMPIYALILTMYLPSQEDFLFNQNSLYNLLPEAKLALLYMFIIFSVLAPGLSLVILRRRNVISDIQIANRRERGTPMLIMLVYCLVLYLLFVFKAEDGALPKYIYALPLSGVFVIGVFAIINRFKKISLHAAGAGILSGFVFAYCAEQMVFEFWILLGVISISGVILSARLYLQKHSQIEVLLGWTLSFLFTFLVNYYYPA